MRGHAVIIVNVKPVAKSGFKKRKGAANDADNLQRAFCTKLGFNWLNQGQDSRDLTKSKWMHSKKKPPPDCECMTCKIQKTDHSNSECFLLVMSSHGREDKGEQKIRFSDGKRVALSKIINSLADEKCPTLRGKPRILILQACRSNYDLPEEQQEDPGSDVLVLADEIQEVDINDTDGSSGDEDDTYPESGNELGQGDQAECNNGATAGAKQKGEDGSSSGEESDADLDEETSIASLSNIPANFLIVYPTTAGKKSKRSTSEGSWLIVELCKVIDDHNFENDTEMDFLKILTKAAGRVARNREAKKIKNAPCIVHRLIEPLIFKNVADETENAPRDKPAL